MRALVEVCRARVSFEHALGGRSIRERASLPLARLQRSEGKFGVGGRHLQLAAVRVEVRLGHLGVEHRLEEAVEVLELVAQLEEQRLEGAMAVLSASTGAMASSLVPGAAAGERKGRVSQVVPPRPWPQQGAGR